MTNVFAHNDLTGKTVEVTRNQLDHPILGANLREVRSRKRRGRLSEIIKEDAPASSKARRTEPDASDKDKED